MSVEIDNPELRAASEVETKKHRAARAQEFLMPEIRKTYEEQRRRKRFADITNAELLFEEASKRLLQALNTMNYSEFELDRKRWQTQSIKAMSEGKDVDSAEDLSGLMSAFNNDYMRKFESLVEGKQMSETFMYHNTTTGDVDYRQVFFVPEFRNNSFIVKEILPVGKKYEHKTMSEVVAPVPLDRLENDFGFTVGSPVPHEAQEMNVDFNEKW